MKPTGIVRRIDDLGRVVIPTELRRTLGIGHKSDLEIYTEGDWVIVEKLEKTCAACGSAVDLVPFKRIYLCETCCGDLFENIDSNEETGA
ncbi:AbrB/MazE/SpoVT family DNA-binding domain-containing protein [Paenibacillus sp. GYB003]|uniref:AbrB/MazE/SpoVT family DNA-binding domain-containing protein n=1 Tax=Paenibacillus sp. GYB003 TaxID=2994392 RepID=UPI002F9636C3